MKVSVLIPAYNVEKYITQCLESVCNQTYHDLQIVVIDDGSKDSTFDIISKLAEKDSRIEVLSRENRGVAQTRNELLDEAKGDFVLFVDSDDWIEPDMITTLLDYTDAYSVDLTMCRMLSPNSDQKNAEDKISIWEKDSILKKFIEHRELTGSLCNKLIRRDLFAGIRFKTGVCYGEDAMVMWDILNRIDKMVYTRKCFYNYRMNDTSISHQGLSESKMSALQVWDYISTSVYAQKNNLVEKAKARYGAEITLLLLSAIGSKNTGLVKERINILRNRLKGIYPYMLKTNYLSYKFKIFTGLILINWPLVNCLLKRIKKFS